MFCAGGARGVVPSVESAAAAGTASRGQRGRNGVMCRGGGRGGGRGGVRGERVGFGCKEMYE